MQGEKMHSEAPKNAQKCGNPQKNVQKMRSTEKMRLGLVCFWASLSQKKLTEL